MKVKVLRCMVVFVCTVACAAVGEQDVKASSTKGATTLCLLTDSGEWSGVRAESVMSEDGSLKVTAEGETYGWVFRKLRVDPALYSRLVIDVRKTSGIFTVKVLNPKGDNAWVELLRTQEIGQHILDLPFSAGEKKIQIAIYMLSGNTAQFNEIRLLP